MTFSAPTFRPLLWSLLRTWKSCLVLREDQKFKALKLIIQQETRDSAFFSFSIKKRFSVSVQVCKDVHVCMSAHQSANHLVPPLYCKCRIFRMHFIFVDFVRGGFCTKIKCTRKIQSKSENPQRPAAVRKFHAYERSEVPNLQKFSAYEIFWIYRVKFCYARASSSFSPLKSKCLPEKAAKQSWSSDHIHTWSSLL